MDCIDDLWQRLEHAKQLITAARCAVGSEPQSPAAMVSRVEALDMLTVLEARRKSLEHLTLQADEFAARVALRCEMADIASDVAGVILRFAS